MSEAMKWDGDGSRISERIKGKDYIILKLSEYVVGKDADVSLLGEPEEIMEAHFFDEHSWIHIYEYDGELWINEVPDNGEEGLEERQSLRTSQTLICRKTIAYDDYGQAYFSGMRPLKLVERDSAVEKQKEGASYGK